jgi:hypothetical protein
LSSARAARTLRNYRLPALKRVCYALTRRLSWPLAGDMFGLYLARLYKERDNIGAPTTTENAMSLLCSMNDVDPAPYASSYGSGGGGAPQPQARGEKVRGLNGWLDVAHQPAARLCATRPRPRAATGICVRPVLSVAIEFLLRYGDLARCIWDPDYCDVFHTHVRFYVEGRKTRRMGALSRVLRGRRTTTRSEFIFLACALRITSARATCYRTSTTARAQ